MTIGRLSALQIQRLIQTVAMDSECVAFTNHARIRMRQRHISRDLVLDVLRYGRLSRVPEPNPRFGSLECRMERYDAGRQISVIVALCDGKPEVLVVTVIAA
jgi:hypothetical protein